MTLAIKQTIPGLENKSEVYSLPSTWWYLYYSHSSVSHIVGEQLLATFELEDQF